MRGREIAQTDHVDVVVIGGGTAGCCAAIAAARNGASTVLVDRLPFIGGTSTAVLDTFYAFYTAGSNPQQVVRGLGWEVVERLQQRGACMSRPNSFGSGMGITYEQEALKAVWDALLAAAGVRVLTGALMCDAVETDTGTVVTVAAKGGWRRFIANVAVDASGDADMVLAAGGAALQDDLEALQPATMTFQLANVDTDVAFPTTGRRPLREFIEEAKRDGYDLPGISGSVHRTPMPGVVHAAMTRVPSPDPDDPDSWRNAEAEARTQVASCVCFLRERVPGYRQAILISTSAALGVRETRRVSGRHVLSEQEILTPTVPDNSIALCGAPIEDLATEPTRWVHIPEPGYYGIPFDCLKPIGLNHILVAGRCFSATHSAHSSARSMATCMAMGHAAGLAASLAVRNAAPVVDVDADELRKALESEGALATTAAAIRMKKS